MLHSSSQSPGVSASEALQRLKDGNDRFAAGRSRHSHLGADWLAETADEGQAPFATVLGCSDSRAGVELLFDAGMSDIFVVRVAGNVVGTHEAGSIEYAVEHLRTPLLVVLGHTRCGAVAAAAKGLPPKGNVRELLAPITPVVEKTRQDHPKADPCELLDRAIEANVWNSIEQLLVRSQAVREAAARGRLRVEGAVYDIHSGQVRWLEDAKALAAASVNEEGQEQAAGSQDRCVG